MYWLQLLVWVIGVVCCTQAGWVRRDDSDGHEIPDTAKGLPKIHHVPFAGSDKFPHSPPYLHSPNTTGRGVWAEPVERARNALAKLSMDDMVKIVTGTGFGNGLCVGNIGPVKKIGFPGLCVHDSPTGPRGVDLVTVFPPAITVGATFSKDLMYARAQAIGDEFRTKGIHVHLGPMVNVMRAPSAGRNWEGFGADPYLNGEGAHHHVRGIQSQGVQATVKHYTANEQEHFRNTGSSNLDERTEREIYMHPFMRGAFAGAAAFMTAYNLVNNSWSSQSSLLINQRLKTELGFQGYIMTDWGAHHSGVASALAGLDMSMPGDAHCCQELHTNSSFWGPNLTQAVSNGSVPEWRVRDMATRVLAGYYLVGQDKDFPKTNFNFWDINDPMTNAHVDATKNHSIIARDVVNAGTVLLKNKNETLPLKKPRKIAIVGSDASPFPLGPNYWDDRIGWPFGALGEGWGSGSVEYSYLISPYEALQARARKNNTGVNWSFDDFNHENAKKVANYTDVALVFVTSLSGEGFGSVPKSHPQNKSANMGDRNNLTLWNSGEQLIKSVASVNNNTVVIVHSVGPVLMEDWIEHPNVTAVLWANLPGSESGSSIVDVLYGDYNPSGRLPYTIAKERKHYPADVMYNSKIHHPQINFTEGLMVDYRWFDHKNISPRFEFGFGLSYTQFKYHDLNVAYVGDAKLKNWNDHWGHKNATTGLPSWLFKKAYNVTFQVENTGKFDGHEVPQLYVGFPKKSGEPPRVLRAFDRVWIPAGQNRTISHHLSHYDLSIWNTSTQQWLRPDGNIRLHVGASSRNLHLHKDLP